jgi:hypothetical protein
MSDEAEHVGMDEERLVGLVTVMIEAAQRDPRWTGRERIFISLSADSADDAEYSCGVGQFEGYDGRHPNVLLNDIQSFLQGTAQRTGMTLQFMPMQSLN